MNEYSTRGCRLFRYVAKKAAKRPIMKDGQHQDASKPSDEETFHFFTKEWDQRGTKG